MGDNIVEFKGVYKKYGKKEVFKNFEIEIPKGKIVGLLGQNGSGEITICTLKNSIQIKNMISYLPEKTYLNEDMKVKDISLFQ